MQTIRLAAVAVALTIGSTAFAQTYIVPDGDCGAVTLHVSRGEDFPNGGGDVAADRVSGAYVWTLPKPRRDAELVEKSGALTFGAEVPADQVVMAGVDLKPVVNDNETRTEHAKALVFCGPATPSIDWQRSMGLGLEIYPQGWNGPRPLMKAGDTMRFIAVDGSTKQLIPDLPMDLYGPDGLIAHGTQAHQGGMNFTYQKPGRYMVVTTYRRRNTEKSDRWFVDTSTLTFDIK